MDKQITEARIYTEGVNDGYNKAIEEFEKMIYALENKYGWSGTIERLKPMLQKMKEKK